MVVTGSYNLNVIFIMFEMLCTSVERIIPSSRPVGRSSSGGVDLVYDPLVRSSLLGSRTIGVSAHGEDEGDVEVVNVDEVVEPRRAVA